MPSKLIEVMADAIAGTKVDPAKRAGEAEAVAALQIVAARIRSRSESFRASGLLVCANVYEDVADELAEHVPLKYRLKTVVVTPYLCCRDCGESFPAKPPPLTFDRFQAANAKRCPEGFDHSIDNWSLLEWAGAAAGEMGEVANVCKKLKRKEQGVGGKWAKKDPDEATLRANLAEEIGDVLAYLALLATAAGLDLGRCAAEKFDRVSDKIEWNGERLLASPKKEG